MGTAAFIHAAGDIRIGPFSPEQAGSDSVMVRVASVGVCGSDLHSVSYTHLTLPTKA